MSDHQHHHNATSLDSDILDNTTSQSFTRVPDASSWDRIQTVIVLCCQTTQEECYKCGSNCYLCCFDPRTGTCSPQNRAKLTGTCNSLNLSVLWNGVKNTYNRWPAATILTLLTFIFFFSYLIFVRVSSPGEDQSIITSEINKTLALGGFLMLLIMLTIAGLLVTCGHEILNLYSSSPTGLTFSMSESNIDTLQQQHQQIQTVGSDNDIGSDDNTIVLH